MASIDTGYNSYLSDNDNEDVDVFHPPIAVVNPHPPSPENHGLLNPQLLNFPVATVALSPSKLLDPDLEYTEEQLGDSWEEHEKKKENNRANEGNDELLKAHNFFHFISMELTVYHLPQTNYLFNQMISKFTKIPLDNLIIVKRISQKYNQNLIGLCIPDCTATMITYADQPLITEITEIPKTKIQFHDFSTEEIQALLQL